MNGGITFAQWLRQRRKARDLTQEELADRIASSPETIRKIEAGRRRPSKQMVEVLAEYLRVPPEEWPALVQFARVGPDVDDAELTISSDIGQKPRAQKRAVGTLPALRTTFIGRVQEVDTVRALLLQEDVRLLTLTGPPGIGKTRLGLQVAATMAGDFQDGVVFVPLSPVKDPSMVVPTICKTLEIKEVSGQPLSDTLASFLRDKHTLLFLDNFEQVVPAGQEVGELLVQCSELKVLVTSRAALHVYGEHEHLVPTMTLPGPKESPPVEALAQYEAVDLFVQRSKAIKPDFAFTSESAPVVVEICRQLDGLPLAIELAAARSKLLPPQALLARLVGAGLRAHPKLNLLTAGMTDLPARQQTLRGAIAWSYDLLDDEERALFRRMSVLVGGTLDAVEAVAGDRGLEADVLAIPNILDLAASLMDKSLIWQPEVEGEPRFSMYWTIREYAQERLVESGEADDASRRHAVFYLRLAEAAEPHLTSAERGEWLDILEEEHHNLRAALAWCQSDTGDREIGLRIAGALHWFWYFRGWFSEGRDSLDKALALAGSFRRTAVGAKALNAAGRLAYLQDDYAVTRPLLEESVSIWREIGDKRGLAYALTNLGIVKVYRTREASSGGQSLVEEAISLFREVNDKWGLAFALDSLGDVMFTLGGSEYEIVSHKEKSLALYRELDDGWGTATELSDLGYAAQLRGDYENARSMLEEALALERVVGDKWFTANIVTNLGVVTWQQGQYERAEALYGEALSLFRELGDRLRTSIPLRVLGHLTLNRGDYEEAEALYKESLRLVYELQSVPNISLCLAALAGMARLRKQPHRVAKLLGAATAQREASHGLIPPPDAVEYNCNFEAARSLLDKEAFAKAWDEGRALSLDEAVAYAREKSENTSRSEDHPSEGVTAPPAASSAETLPMDP